MSCWSTVNIALIPFQKSMIVKLGCVTVTVNAMIHHSYNAEVQFWTLLALINLVKRLENISEYSAETITMQEQLEDVNQITEKEMFNESVRQIVNLVVVAMTNFCSSDAILNQVCLVLHILLFNEDYHNTLLWTPTCYQILGWFIGKY
eukprot:10526989-Ditylum_brightwellii.AAC.1